MTVDQESGVEQLRENRDSLERLAESDLPVNDIAEALLEIADEKNN